MSQMWECMDNQPKTHLFRDEEVVFVVDLAVLYGADTLALDELAHLFLVALQNVLEDHRLQRGLGLVPTLRCTGPIFIKYLKSNVYVTLNAIGSFQCNLCSHWLIQFLLLKFLHEYRPRRNASLLAMFMSPIWYINGKKCAFNNNIHAFVLSIWCFNGKNVCIHWLCNGFHQRL